MPALVDVLRERFNAHQDALRVLEDEIVAAGGQSTDEQDTRMRDLSNEMAALTPRLEQAVTVERQAVAGAALLARAPAHAPLPNGVTPETLYRDAGEYLAEYVRAMGNDAAARSRLTSYIERAAQNQTTVDNPGIVPDPIVGGVLTFIDTMRPMVAAFGVRTLPAYPSFHRPHVTQHTSVAKQAAEKSELASRKMLIERLTVTAETYGGYVDLSLQDRDFTNPAIMGILIDDLAGQYALATEAATAADVVAAATATVPLESTGDAAAVAAAIYQAAGLVYTAMGTLPNVVFASVDQWGRLGPIFPGTNPQNAYGAGFNAGTFGGSVVGLQLVVAPALPPGTIIVGSTAAAEVYEQRVGTLQALEVSLLGMQVGYAGFFADVIVNAGGFAKVADTTP